MIGEWQDSREDAANGARGTIGAVAVVVSTVYAVRQIIRVGLQPGDIAAVPGFLLGVAGLVTAARMLRRQVEGNEASLLVAGAQRRPSGP
jgi:hypothetical protein